MSVDRAAVAALLTRARREVDDGLLPSCQLALAIEGELVAFETIGDATDTTRYCLFSATKPFVAATIWTLLADGVLRLDQPVAELVPAFGSNGKHVVTLEHVLLHTCGFPYAPLGPPAWSTRDGREAAFAKWRLDWEPGTQFTYHATAAHWVLAALIEAVTGNSHTDEVQKRVTDPAGLPRMLGLATGAAQDAIAPLGLVGEEATEAEIKAAFGVDALPPAIPKDQLLLMGDEAAIAVGVPGGGGCLRAAELALFYQVLLHDPDGIWPSEVRADATSRVRTRLPDPYTGVPANRTIGLVVAGDDGLASLRGMGRTVSASAFGHNGAGGQIAWADPETGLSFAYLTNGLDRNEVREPRRTTALASLAGVCATRRSGAPAAQESRSITIAMP